MAYHYLSSEHKQDAVYITSLNAYLCTSDKAPETAHTRVLGHSINLDTLRQQADVARSDAAASVGELSDGLNQLKNASWSDEFRQFATVKGLTKPQTFLGMLAGTLLGRYVVPKQNDDA